MVKWSCQIHMPVRGHNKTGDACCQLFWPGAADPPAAAVPGVSRAFPSSQHVQPWGGHWAHQVERPHVSTPRATGGLLPVVRPPTPGGAAQLRKAMLCGYVHSLWPPFTMAALCCSTTQRRTRAPACGRLPGLRRLQADDDTVVTGAAPEASRRWH